MLIEDLDMQLVLDSGDPYELLEKVKNSQNTGIYFLDIDLNSNIHKVILHAIDRQIEFSSTIKVLTNTLDGNFVRCHRSFLVNRNNIKEVDVKNRIIYFTNGETCLISTRMMKGLL